MRLTRPNVGIRVLAEARVAMGIAHHGVPTKGYTRPVYPNDLVPRDHGSK